MMHICDFPRSAAYLKASNYRLNDPAMTLYAWAVCLSEAWTDEELVEIGTIDFATMTGEQLLPELDRLLGQRKKPSMSPDDRESLKAFIGSRGVKVSALKGPDDYWHVASILWPHSVKAGERGKLSKLLSTIRSMPKKERRTASVNINAVPAKWRASA